MGFTQDIHATLTVLDPGVKLYIAYSGGLDSHSLLHITAAWAAQHGRELTALHVNHGLSPNADRWQAFCERECARLGVNIRCNRVSIDRNGVGSLEQCAREFRYDWFESVLEDNGVLLLAHHREDQAETLLLRLLRGAGMRGLSSIPVSRRLGRGRVLRPLLNAGKEDLRAYAVEKGLEWIEDESNQCLDMDRNFLRHRVIPALTERWPRFAHQFARSVDNLRHDQVLLDELAELDAQALRMKAYTGYLDLLPPLELNGFKALSTARQRNLLQYLVKPLTVYPLPVERLREWLRQVDAVTDTTQARLEHENLLLVLHDGRMHFIVAHREVDAPGKQITWRTDASLVLPELGLELSLCESDTRLVPDSESLAFSSGDALCVHWRQGGERVKMPGEGFSRSLKKILQERRVAPWLRRSMPLVSCDGHIIWSAVLGDFSPSLVDENGRIYSFELVRHQAN